MSSNKYLNYEGLKYLYSKINDIIDDTTKYEIVNLTITTDWGREVNTTVTVTVDGEATDYSYNNSPITFKIEGGKQYTVSFANIDYHTSPPSMSYTAISNFTRSLTATYIGVPNGIYIVDNNGRLNNVSSWTGGSNATGVALINDNVQIIIAPKDWHTYNSSDDGAWNGNKTSAWGGYGKTVTGIKSVDFATDAITDFAGSANTDAIISQLKGVIDNYNQKYGNVYIGAPAAEYCRAYSNGCKGVGQWYLPAAGEYNQIVLNQAAIEEALTAISGELFSSPGRGNWGDWTSTLYVPGDSGYAAICDWTETYGNLFVGQSRYAHNGVRPICAL